MNYPGSQCFLICFSVTQISSAEGVVKKWVEEVRGSKFYYPSYLLFLAKCPETPIIIVGMLILFSCANFSGTKIDLREDKKELESLKKDGKVPLTLAQGEQLAEAVGGNKYMEYVVSFVLDSNVQMLRFNTRKSWKSF